MAEGKKRNGQLPPDSQAGIRWRSRVTGKVADKRKKRHRGRTENAQDTIMDLIVDADLAVGNGILTVENRTQALKRAVDKNKGADAANAALALIALRDRFGSAK